MRLLVLQIWQIDIALKKAVVSLLVSLGLFDES